MMANKSCSLLISVFFGLCLFAVLFWGIYSIWPLLGIDWRETFYPAAHNALHGENPYSVPTFRNVPWTILLLSPFALFSEDTGGVLYFMASIAGYAWVAYRLKASPLAFTAFMFSSPVVYGLRMLNVDFLVLIGFTLPAPIGLFLVLIKPQMGIGMALYWLAEAWREGGMRSVARTFAPITISLAVSFLIFGNWITGRQSDLLGSFWNAGFWPWALPVGLVLTALSIRDRRMDYGMAASPFLSPYLAYHSWAGVFAALLRYDFQLVIAVIGMWIAGIVHGIGL